MTEEYPPILTPDNIWVIGVTQEPSTEDYFLVLYNDIHALLNRFIRFYEGAFNTHLKYMQYVDFDEIKEIGSGGYGTIYTAKYKYSEVRRMPEIVVLKRFKRFDQMPELFINEVSVLWYYQLK